MGLSNDLIAQFVKATNDTSNRKTTITTYGTTVEKDNNMYVKLDGAADDKLIPLSSTADVKDKERVMVTVSNHTATVTGNITSPAARTDDVKSIWGTVVDFDQVVANALSTVQADIDSLRAENISVTDRLEATEADIDILYTANVSVTERLDADEALIKDLKANKLDVSVAKITYATIESLDATNLKVYNLQSAYANFEVATTERLEAAEADIESLKTDKLDAEKAEITYATIEHLNATDANVTSLEANVADIDTLIFGSATGTTILTSFANAVIAQLGNAQIKSAMIESIAADKITAGDIITNNVRVMSEDGLLLISDETIQISDGVRVRVQIGKDANSDYSINVWDADGNLMFSEGGITDKAIKQAIIRNDMVSDTANIAAHKLDIDSLFKEINGSSNTIKSTQIYLDDENQTLDVAFEELTTEVSEQGETITSQGTQIEVIQGQINSKVWQQDVDAAKSVMSTQYSTLSQELDGFKTTVAETYATQADVDDVDTRVTSAESAIVQNSDLLALRVEELSIAGRNLIVRKDELVDTYVVDSGEVVDCESGYHSATMLRPIRVEAGEAYTFSKTEGFPGIYFRWAWYTEDMVVLGRTANDESSFTWTVPENAAYIIVSYPNIDGCEPKLEKGSEVTPFTLAPEDTTDAIKSVDAKFDNYSTTVEMEAAIKLEADNITSKVATTYTTKNELSELEIGGVNLIKNSNFTDGLDEWIPTGITAESIEDDTHGTCLRFTSPEVGSPAYRIYPSTTTNFNHGPGVYSLSFYAKADAPTTIQSNVAGGNGGACNYSLTTEWQRFTHTYAASTTGSITFWANEVDIPIYITKIKMEHGDKATDWSPAPEDTALTSDITAIEASVDAVDERVTISESVIQQLSESIMMLVTDGNGESLMTQTDSGWTFSTGSIQTLINATSEGLNDLTHEVGDINATVDILHQAVDEFGVLSEYVKITTYEGEPCIELGESDSEFRLLITNTRMLFLEGLNVLAYFNNQSLHISKAVVEDELQQGEFVWKVRSNGNLGLMWKGVDE